MNDPKLTKNTTFINTHYQRYQPKPSNYFAKSPQTRRNHPLNTSKTPKQVMNFINPICPGILIYIFEVFLACRLVLLDKNPGLRPIELGEVLRR